MPDLHPSPSPAYLTAEYIRRRAAGDTLSELTERREAQALTAAFLATAPMRRVRALAELVRVMDTEGEEGGR